VIVTITPNPSVDRTLTVPTIQRGAVIRVTGTASEAGGKGINVARSLTTMDVPAVAIVPASESGAALLDGLLAGAARLRIVPISGDVRVNLSLVEPDGTVTKVNEPGAALDATAATRLLDDVTAAVLAVLAAAPAPASDAERHWLVGCGSLPPGLPETFYRDLAERMPSDVRVAVDADRGALRAVAGSPVALLKPNRAELEELTGRDLETLGAVADAAAELVAGGPARVLVSLGADGALVVDGLSACHAEAPIDDVANPVGAGDALLAGFLAGGATAAALPNAIAWSVAACRAPGTRMPPITTRDRAAVVVRADIDRSRRLAR
jgi:1-phosphofructokinase